METVEDENIDSKQTEKKDAATDATSGVSLRRSNRVPSARLLDPFLLQAILLKIEHKGTKTQFRHRKRVESFHRSLCLRYADLLSDDEAFSLPAVQEQATGGVQADPAAIERDRSEQLARRVSHIKGRGLRTTQSGAHEEPTKEDKEKGIIAMEKVAKMFLSKASKRPKKKVNNAEQSKNAMNRWQMAIGLVLGLAKIAAFHIEEKEHLRVGDLIFDPSTIKEVTNVVSLSDDSKFALSLIPERRTEDQVRQVVVNLHDMGIKSFCEYPESLQLKLAKVARYEIVTSQRVIMRQGRPAEHFFVLLKGTVVAIEKGDYPDKGGDSEIVEESERDEYQQEDESEDLVVFRKGVIFGETEMVSMLKRRMTVISKGRVELLSIERNELLGILEQRSLPNEYPDHIRFLQQCEFAEHWPIDKLVDDLHHCSPYFFKKNSMMVEDSMRTDFLVVIRTGQCRVIRKLYKKRCTIEKQAEPKSKSMNMQDYNDEQLRQNFRRFTRSHSSQHYPGSSGGDPLDRDMTVGAHVDDHPPPTSEQEKRPNSPLKLRDSERLAKKSQTRLQSLRSSRLSCHGLSKTKKNDSRFITRADHDYWNTDSDTDDTKVAVYIQIDVIEENEVFGLETLFFDKYYDTMECSGLCLVSGEDEQGVDVVLLSKSYFVEHSSEQIAWRVRRMMKSYPLHETLLEEVERQELWGVSKQGMEQDSFTGKPLFLKKLSWKCSS